MLYIEWGSGGIIMDLPSQITIFGSMAIALLCLVIIKSRGWG